MAERVVLRLTEQRLSGAQSFSAAGDEPEPQVKAPLFRRQPHGFAGAGQRLLLLSAAMQDVRTRAPGVRRHRLQRTRGLRVLIGELQAGVVRERLGARRLESQHVGVGEHDVGANGVAGAAEQVGAGRNDLGHASQFEAFKRGPAAHEGELRRHQLAEVDALPGRRVRGRSCRDLTMNRDLTINNDDARRGRVRSDGRRRLRCGCRRSSGCGRGGRGWRLQ